MPPFRAPFSLVPLLRPDVPAAAPRYSGSPPFNFIGGHNDPASTPVDGLQAAANAVLAREGRSLATYGLASGPQGYLPLRDFLVRKLRAHAGIICSADELLVTSGSLQGLDLVNAALVSPGDTVLIEEDCYGGSITRLQRAGARIVGVQLDDGGMRMDALATALDGLRREGVRAKYLYTIPTVQNPSGSVLDLERRRELLRLAQAHGVPVFEDDCYADLVYDGARPPALLALARESGWQGVIHIGSFSKSVAPALRVGFVLADWEVISRLLALKTDAGSGALEQMVLAEFCATQFDSHLATLNTALKRKASVLVEALAEHFGTAAEFKPAVGGIFLWVRLPEVVDTGHLAVAAAAAGIAINPGTEWSVRGESAKRWLRLCFAHPSEATIRDGVAALAAVCHKEFGVPQRVGNVVLSH